MTIRALHDAVLFGPGELDADVRLACARGEGMPPELAAYGEKVSRHAHTVTDADLDALRERGYSDEQIFEATVAIALGVGLFQRDRGVAALG